MGETNTIIITSLPTEFFHPSLQTSLRSHFSSYGTLQAWISLSGLARILVVYKEPSAALSAKEEMDRFVIEGCDLETSQVHKETDWMIISQEERDLIKNLPKTVFRVYLGPNTPLSNLSSSPTIYNDNEDQKTDHKDQDRLKPPVSDKNFLISPPGSPPVGWEQIIEDAPNQTTLADDLCQRLRFLSVGDQDENEDEDEEPHQRKKNKEVIDSDQSEIIILKSKSNLPTLKVQPIESIGKTPGMEINLVKATIESMVSNRITPTARPTLSG